MVSECFSLVGLRYLLFWYLKGVGTVNFLKRENLNYPMPSMLLRLKNGQQIF